MAEKDAAATGETASLPKPDEIGEFFLSKHGKICKSGQEPGTWFICGADFSDDLKLDGQNYRHFSSPEEALMAIVQWQQSTPTPPPPCDVDVAAIEARCSQVAGAFTCVVLGEPLRELIMGVVCNDVPALLQLVRRLQDENCELRIDSENYRGKCALCMTANCDMLKDDVCVACERDELKDKVAALTAEIAELKGKLK